jgi:hypothetical protein
VYCRPATFFRTVGVNSRLQFQKWRRAHGDP